MATGGDDTAWTYEFDSLGQLISVHHPDPAVFQESYIYDHRNRLVGVIDDFDKLTIYNYDGENIVSAMQDGDVLWEAAWGPGTNQLIAFHDVAAQEAHIPLVDYRNSIVATWNVTDQEVSQIAEYDPNGVVSLYNEQENLLCNDGNCPNVNNLPFGFTSALRSPVTGLIHMRARWYSPQLGQFISPDPLGYIDSYNLYSYALFDPINNWDPYGLSGGGFVDFARGFGSALGNAALSMGKMSYNNVRHPIASKLEIGQGLANTWNDAYQLDGVLGGVNAFNPLYHGIIGYYEFEQSLARGQHHQAGQHFVDYIGGVAGTASIGASAGAAGSARLGSKAPGQQNLTSCPGGKCAPGQRVCFTAGTLIEMCDGEHRAIETLEEGELVWAWDEATGESDCRPIAETFARGTEMLLALDIVDDGGQVEQITTTAEHPFYRPELGRFVRADELVIGDALLSSSGAWLRVGSATWVQQSATVYNLAVDEFHTYFVGQAGTLVHNTCDGNRITDPRRLLTERAGLTAHISPSEVINKIFAQIDTRAKQLGLEPRGPNPAAGRGSYIDPQTGQQRILSHPNASPAHGHVNNAHGQRIGPNGNIVLSESPEAHLPIRILE